MKNLIRRIRIKYAALTDKQKQVIYAIPLALISLILLTIVVLLNIKGVRNNGLNNTSYPVSYTDSLSQNDFKAVEINDLNYNGVDYHGDDYSEDDGGQNISYPVSYNVAVNPVAPAHPANKGTMDFGDAPAPYPTLLKDDGARHGDKGPYLKFRGAMYAIGSEYESYSTEEDGIPTFDAEGDKSDASFFCCGAMYLNQNGNGASGIHSSKFTGYYVEIESRDNTNKTPYLSAWIDLNGDGDWADDGEQIYKDIEMKYGLNDNLFSGVNVNVTTKETYVYARFRISTQKGLSYKGYAEDGEVEDYKINLTQE
jgi:hypothetical protein